MLGHACMHARDKAGHMAARVRSIDGSRQPARSLIVAHAMGQVVGGFEAGAQN
jgi:hypothetical protein